MNKRRAQILAEFNSKCAYCGARARILDHMVPRAKGGTNAIANLVACCMPCTIKKADKPFEQWLGVG
jgi:5-methylcytosine-specific restriction endonuclease McrA